MYKGFSSPEQFARVCAQPMAALNAEDARAYIAEYTASALLFQNQSADWARLAREALNIVEKE